MQSVNKHPDLQRWWQQYQAAAVEPCSEDLTGRMQDCLGLGLKSKQELHLLQILELLSAVGVDDQCLAVACDYFVCRLGEPTLLELTPQIIEIDRLEKAYDPESATPEGLRRLLLAIVGDVRVVLIVLADRLVMLRAATGWSDARRRPLALAAHAIFAPLANRLGIWQLKWELEDLVFRFLEPELYQRIAGLLAEKRVVREQFIRQFIRRVTQALSGAEISSQVVGRPKHIYSIWRKMQRKGLAFSELHDIRAIRVLVDSVADCYAALGIVHSQWPPVPGEFDDYIANPKGNNYRSLHTAVFGAEGKTVEVQIRTHEMHDHAELGVAAHWRYKEGGQHDPAYQRKLNWMRQLLEGGEDELLEEFGAGGNDERVYVLTPRGDVLELAAGSTVLDFAYLVHTSVGNRCRGAKVNGRIVPLTYILSNGEQVEILTARQEDPSRDWLVPRLGYLHSARSRAKVRQWFRLKDRDRNLAEGREILDKELRRLAAHAADLEPLVPRFNFKDMDGLYVAVAIGEVTVGQIAAALEELRRPDDDDVLPLARASGRRKAPGKGDLYIDGVGQLMTVMANCCSPVPGDPIVGFITRARGVSIHRRDCKNVDRLIRTDPARMLEVSWGGETHDRYEAEIRVRAYDRKGLVRDIGNLTGALRCEMLSFNSRVDQGLGEADISMVVQVSDYDHLNDLLNRLAALPNVLEARRVG